MPLLEGIVYHGPTVDGVNDAGAQALVVESGVLVGSVYMWFLHSPAARDALPQPHCPRRPSKGVRALGAKYVKGVICMCSSLTTICERAITGSASLQLSLLAHLNVLSRQKLDVQAHKRHKHDKHVP